MKKLLLFLAGMLFITYPAMSQSIINGNFEQWNSKSAANPVGTVTSNQEALKQFGVNVDFSVEKTSDAQLGSFAVKITTKKYGNDTMFGYVVFGQTGNDGPEGGYPYTQTPDSITGWYKSNFVAGDSGLILIMFKKNGIETFVGMYYLAQSKSTYTRFSFKLNFPVGFTCDTVMIAFASSDPFTDYTAKPGSWLQIDNVSFVGTGITQQVPNSNFELWNTYNFETPVDWFSVFNDTLACNIAKSTDKYKGNYAAKITTFYFPSYMINLTTNGKPGNNGIDGGKPFNKQVDTLIGYYKYFPKGNDSAFVYAVIKKNGTAINYSMKYLPPASTYTYFELQINSPMVPDSLILMLCSSPWTDNPAHDGSVLIIDEVQLKSQPLGTSITSSTDFFQSIIFPNPTSNNLNCKLKLSNISIVKFEIYDISGKLVRSKQYNGTAGINEFQFDISDLESANYILKILSDGEMIKTSRIIKQ